MRRRCGWQCALRVRENFCPWRSSMDKRHMSTPADANSITLSIPNAIKTRLPAVTPAAMATRDSTVIHPIVSHSSRKASRMSGRRSDRGDTKSGGGAQSSPYTEDMPIRSQCLLRPETHAPQQIRGGFEIGCQACSSSSKALASFRSSVSKLSVNQP